MKRFFILIQVLFLILQVQYLFAEEKMEKEKASTLVVKSKRLEDKNLLNQKIDSGFIENTISNNGDIGSLLKINPNVKVDENKEDLTSIEPSKIKINEAKFYQNLFLVDGLSSDSILDPVSSNRIDDVQGNENEVFLDLDLVDSILVYDSGVPAKFGGFSGGVIDVKLKRPPAKPTGKISYRYTGDEFTSFHIKSEDGNFEKKPEFEKGAFNFMYSGALNDYNGLIFSYSNKYGKKPEKHMDGTITLENRSQNFLLKHSKYFETDASLDTSIMHFPYEKDGLMGRYTKDSQYKTKGGGLSINSGYERIGKTWSFNSDIGLKQSENTRTTKTDYLKNWRKSKSKNWGNTGFGQNEVLSVEGSWGDLEKTQKSILSKFDFNKNFKRHNVNTGVQMDYRKGSHKRDEELRIYKDAIVDSGIKCNGSTEDCQENEQFFSRRDIYQKEDVEADLASMACYVEDSLTIKNVKLNLGLRGDYNSFLENIDIAPRVNSQISFFGDRTKFFAGFNRYYAKAFLGFKLREARTPYRSEYRSKYQDELNSDKIPPGEINPTVWNTSSDKGSDKYIFSDLETPYTDEKVFGFNQVFLKNFIFKAKLVSRESKKQFTMNQGEKTPFTRPDGMVAYYHPKVTSNKGSSSSDIYSLDIQNIESLKFYKFRLDCFLTYSHSNSETNFETYDTIDEKAESFYIKLNGNVAESHEISSYEKPDTYRFLANINTPDISFFNLHGDLNTSLLFTYYPSYIKPVSTGHSQDIVIDGERMIVPVYEDRDIDAQKNIDLRIAFNATYSQRHKLILSFDIFNLLDSVDEDLTDSYQTGRQYWVGVTYKF